VLLNADLSSPDGLAPLKTRNELQALSAADQFYSLAI
jgi:hypothetical protein